jgi:PKD repeat protein
MDSSDNVPSRWLWDFGDGDTASAQNPVHTYRNSGTYSIKLWVFNSFGQDSVLKTSYLTILPTEIKPASCVSTTANACCNFSLDRITIGNVFEFRPSNYVAKSYTDLACDVNFNVDLGKQYPISISSFSARDNVAVYIDFNNNGVFEPSDLSFSGVGSKVHVGKINISGMAVTDSLIRMRVMSEAPFTSNTLQPCDRLQNGQSWDFGLVVNRGTTPPLAKFNASESVTCSGFIQFSDTATTIADNWLWSFGDGSFSQLPNPSHQYVNPGTYTVKLKVQNRFGTDSVTKTDFITVNGSWGPKKPSCIAVTNSGGTAFGITQVVLGSINRTSGFGIEGYQDFTCTDSTSILVSTLNRLTLTVGSTLHQIRVYVDVNDNGILEDGEALVSALIQGSQTLNFVVNPGFSRQVYNKYLRMRIMATPQGQATNACNAILQGQAEDYSLKVINTVGIDNRILEHQLTLAPNPTSGTVLLKADLLLPGEMKVQVTNALGQTFYENAFATDGHLNQELGLEGLVDGIYYLHATIGDLKTVKRLVVRH